MTKDIASFKLDPATRKKIDQLVEDGEYASLSDFITKAIQRQLNLIEFEKEMELRVRIFLESPAGEELFKELAEKYRARRF